mgnify:FL=1
MNRIAAERCKRYAHKEECLNMKKISRRSFLLPPLFPLLLWL